MIEKGGSEYQNGTGVLWWPQWFKGGEIAKDCQKELKTQKMKENF